VAQAAQQVVRLLQAVVVQHQRQSIQVQHQPMVQMVIQPKLAQVVQVVRLIMLELAQRAVTADSPVAGEEAVVVELPSVVQVAQEQQERLW
jgi:hypothetical protein